ncbi:unnamed protein product [Closterium sp. NIES-53]
MSTCHANCPLTLHHVLLCHPSTRLPSIRSLHLHPLLSPSPQVLERVSELIPASLDYLCLFTRDGVPQPIDFPQPITARHVPFSAIHRALSPACLPNADKLFEIAKSASGLRGGANEGGEMETREGGGGAGEDMEWSGVDTISPHHSDSKGAGGGAGKARAGRVEEGVGEGRAGSAGMRAAADMHEWIGAASCGMTRHMNECARRLNTALDSVSSHATSATPPMTLATSPVTSAATGSVHSLRVCGPINSSQVLALIDAVRATLKSHSASHPPCMPWAVVNCWSFASSPGEKRDARRRESCEAGETQAFVLLPCDRYLLFSCVHQGRGGMGAAWGRHGSSMGLAQCYVGAAWIRCLR